MTLIIIAGDEVVARREERGLSRKDLAERWPPSRAWPGPPGMATVPAPSSVTPCLPRAPLRTESA